MPFWRPVQRWVPACTIWPNKWGVEMSWAASNRCRNHGREGTWKDHVYNVSSDFKCLRQFIKETVSWSISTVLAVRVSTTKAQRTANKRIQMKLLLTAEVFPSVWRKGFYTKIPIPEWSPRNWKAHCAVQRGLDRGSEASRLVQVMHVVLPLLPCYRSPTMSYLFICSSKQLDHKKGPAPILANWWQAMGPRLLWWRHKPTSDRKFQSQAQTRLVPGPLFCL